MRADVLPKVAPLSPELIPPDGAQPVGVHTDGRIIYEMKVLDRQRMANEKRQVMDADGNPKWRQHPTTGEKLYPVMELKPVYRTIRFVLRRENNGNIYIQEQFEPTPEEKDWNERMAAKQAFNERLAELATERGLTADELVLRLTSQVKSAGPGQVIVEVPEEELTYPHYKGGGHWLLSDNSAFRGKREDAVAAEAKLALQQQDADMLVESVEE